MVVKIIKGAVRKCSVGENKLERTATGQDSSGRQPSDIPGRRIGERVDRDAFAHARAYFGGLR